MERRVFCVSCFLLSHIPLSIPVEYMEYLVILQRFNIRFYSNGALYKQTKCMVMDSPLRLISSYPSLKGNGRLKYLPNITMPTRGWWHFLIPINLSLFQMILLGSLTSHDYFWRRDEFLSHLTREAVRWYTATIRPQEYNIWSSTYLIFSSFFQSAFQGGFVKTFSHRGQKYLTSWYTKGRCVSSRDNERWWLSGKIALLVRQK